MLPQKSHSLQVSGDHRTELERGHFNKPSPRNSPPQKESSSKIQTFIVKQYFLEILISSTNGMKHTSILFSHGIKITWKNLGL